MNRNIIKRVAAAVVLSGAALASGAQNTISGYFVDDYTYRFQMNPAFGNSKAFVAFPGLGNLNIGVMGDMHLTDFFYNVDGRTTTFLNPKVPTSEVLSNIGDRNRLGLETSIGILSAGWKAWGGYNTIGISARASMELSMPGAMFRMFKEGMANEKYDIGSLRANAIGFAQIALGHSRDITPDIRVGATLKILVGGGYVVADLKDTHIRLGEDSWNVETDAEIHAGVKGLTYQTDVNDRTGHPYVSGAEFDSPGINGFGAAIDLGAVYKTPVPGLTVSAALLDLGFINWKNDVVATTGGVKRFSTDKYTFNVDDNAPNSFDEEFDKIGDDIAALYELSDLGNQGPTTKALHATMNIGAEYALPVYKKLTFGLLNTTRIAGAFSATEFRLSANVAPCKVFSCGVNIAEGTYGFGFGWLANVHVTGFNLFLGMDRIPGKLAKQFVPLNSNMQLNLGLNFLF